VTATPGATPTATATPAAAFLDGESPAALRSLPGAVTPSADALLLSVTMAAGERNSRPVDPTTVFAEGTKRVYAFMLFDGMAQGVPWTHVWYREVDGELQEAWGRSELWSYDYSYGQIWRYFDCGPGKHELHVYVGDQLQKRVPFVVGGN
jgi:hypothetical protein